MESVERSAFAALARQLDPDPLATRLTRAPVPATGDDQQAVAQLAEIYRAHTIIPPTASRERFAQCTEQWAILGSKPPPDLISGDVRLAGCSQLLSDQLRFAHWSTTGSTTALDVRGAGRCRREVLAAS